MAALLKKRALAEYSQSQVIVQEQPKPKKLRLVKKSVTGSSAGVYVGLLEKSKSSNDASQLLLRIAESDELKFEEEDLSEIIRKLSEHFQQEEGSVVRSNILTLYGKIGEESSADVSAVADEIVSLLRREKSHIVIAQGLVALLRLGKLAPDNIQLHQRLVSTAKHYLKDVSHIAKCKCLYLIGGLANVTDVNGQATMRLIVDHAHSEDARVRSAAFRTMIDLHGRGLPLDPGVYPEVCTALKDDYEIVRKVALQLIWVLGQSYPENKVILRDPKEGGETIRLADDAFGKICSSVNDLSMHVRTFAARLLGSMTAVSPRFLQQTLSKSIMSNMRKKRTAHERAWESVTSGEWASGNKWADDAPRELLDGDTLDLVGSGACGAFVHGLEDEYQEVRSASVDSLCSLSMLNPGFANCSVDFLVDMFNDEIEEVRLKAIDSLTKISRYTVLREDQLETILGALKDFSIDVREGLHGMLAACRLSTKACLQMCVESLLDNLKKYPMDRKSTWQCMQRIGQFHPELTLPLTPTLLSVHPFFDVAEPDVEDPAYVCVLILVFNAACYCPSMTQLFEEHTIKHYDYLRDTMPQLVPALKLGGPARGPALAPTSARTADFLATVLNRIETARSHCVRVELLAAAERDLERLAEVDGEGSGAAHFAALHVGCQLLVETALAGGRWADGPKALATQQGNAAKHCITHIMQHCLKLQHLFVCLRAQDRAAVKQLKLKALALQLVYTVRGSNSSALALCEHFLEQVEDTQRYLSEQLLQPDAFTMAVFKEIDQLEETRPGPVARCLLPLLQIASPSPNPSSKVGMTVAEISEPTGDTDVPLKFTAGLVLGVPFDAEIRNLANPHLLRIKVKYPDQQTKLVVPTRSHLRPLSRDLPAETAAETEATDFRLLTTVLFSHQVWTEACTVDVSLALDLTSVEGSVGRKSSKSDAELNVIDLCKPVKVYISPKQVRRGI